MHRLNVYDESTKSFNLDKSKIIQKVFEINGLYKANELWSKVIYQKCKRCYKTQVSKAQNNNDEKAKEESYQKNEETAVENPEEAQAQ